VAAVNPAGGVTGFCQQAVRICAVNQSLIRIEHRCAAFSERANLPVSIKPSSGSRPYVQFRIVIQPSQICFVTAVPSMGQNRFMTESFLESFGGSS
jgi:hypothetical protein